MITFQNGSGTVAFLTDIVGGSSLFTDGGTVTYLTSTTDDLAIGAATLVAPFSIDVDTNILRVGDGTSDTNDPTITFYASDATNSGSLSYLDSDDFLLTGGDLTFAQATTIGDGADRLTFDSDGTIIISDAILNFSADGSITSTTSSAMTIDSGTTGAVNLANGTNAKIVTIGNNTSTTSLNLKSGTGDITLDSEDDYLFTLATESEIDITSNASLVTDGVLDINIDTNIAGGIFTGVNNRLTINDGAGTGDEFVAEKITLVANDADADLIGLSIYGEATLNAAVGSYKAGLRIHNDEDISASMTDALIITSAISGGIMDGIDVSDAELTNAINIGTNIILGTAGVIDFDEFDISGSTGSITINDDGNLGQLSVEGSILDIDSLIFVGAGALSSTGATSDLTLSAGRDITFDDDNLTAAIPLSLSDTDLSSFDAGDRGIIDALNYLRASASSLFTDGGTVSYLTSTSDDLAIGNTSLTAPFSVDVDINTLRIGDGASDANNPTITFYASDATNSGSLSYLDTDGWFFSGGDVYVGNDSESISSTEFSLSGNDVYMEDALGVNGTIYGDDGLKILGEFNQDIDILNAGGTLTTGINGMLKNTFTGTLLTDRQDVGLYTNTESNVSVTSQDYTLVGDYVRANWDPNAPGITPTGNTNIYGRLTDFTTGNITNLDNLIGHRFSIGEGHSINSATISNVEFIDGRFIPGSGIAVTNFKGIYLSADDNSGAGTINDARGLDVSFTDAGAASFTSAYGVYVSEVQATNAYGVYVASVTGSSNDYSIYTADNAGNATFLDNVLVGATSEDITDGVFTVGGDDLFISGQLGVSDLMRLEANFAGFAGGFFNDGGLDNRQGVYLQGCIDSNPTSSCNLLELRDGDGTVIGAIEGNGAGGVTLTSGAADYAELFPGDRSQFVSGDVVALDADNQVHPASTGMNIIGALSNAPNVLGNAFDGWEQNQTFVPVALLGQVPLRVNNEGGPILPGDYLTLSSVPGVAKKAHGAGMMIGRALEPNTTDTGVIQTFIQPGWNGLQTFLSENGSAILPDGVQLMHLDEANETKPLLTSPVLSLRGSVWNGSSADDVSMNLATYVEGTDEYRLSFRNTSDSEIASLSNQGTLSVNGDVVVGGHLYPSEKGMKQTSAYIYYDSQPISESNPSEMGFMRTNAAGWGSGSYDFAETFPSDESLEAGDVVVFAEKDSSIRRGIRGEALKLAGIVSTKPGFLAGDLKEKHYPIALAGRVPTKVISENGAIQIGDPLTISSTSGYAMKATEPGQIIGYALEPFVEGDKQGTIMTFVNLTYYNGGSLTNMPGTTNDASEFTDNGQASFSSLNLNGNIYLNGNDLLSIRKIAGIADRWSIEEDGTIRTEGLLKTVITSHQNEKVETAAVTSPEVVITLMGTATLEAGESIIHFEEIQPAFNDVISPTAPLRVIVTPHGPITLYVVSQDQNGFVVRQAGGVDSGITFDWMAAGYRKDFEPTEPISPEDETAQTETSEELELGEEMGGEVPVEKILDDEDITDQPIPTTDTRVPEETTQTNNESEIQPETTANSQESATESPQP
ncbi:TPA: hypothetical protein DD617_04985 [Candidatus Uhrbacteria bacterium]|nr:hypothetical protein [Candidatus Uhrbacteria bacterium]